MLDSCGKVFSVLVPVMSAQLQILTLDCELLLHLFSVSAKFQSHVGGAPTSSKFSPCSGFRPAPGGPSDIAVELEHGLVLLQFREAIRFECSGL